MTKLHCILIHNNSLICLISDIAPQFKNETEKFSFFMFRGFKLIYTFLLLLGYSWI